MRWISPVPNINGSPADVLAEQMMDVVHALHEAADIMAKWQPHGRDYQVGGDYMTDRREFERRHRMVAELAEQYHQEAMRCMDYHYRRKPREATA